MASAAAEAVIAHVSNSGLPEDVAYELQMSAAEDLEQAQALVTYAKSNFLIGVPVVEGTLYSLVALLYLSRRLHGNVSEVQACCASSRTHIEQVHCLVSFGDRLEAADLNTGRDCDEVSELLEQLWETHCLGLGFQVSSQVRSERVFGDQESINARPLGPARAPAGLLLDSIEVGGKGYSTTPEKTRSPVKTRESAAKEGTIRRGILKFFDLIAVITGSDYFASLPSRSQGHARCKLLGSIDHELGLNDHLADQLERLRKLVVFTYSQVQHDGKEWDFADKEWCLVPLTVAEARKFLAAVQLDEVFRHLVIERSFPNFLMSHEMVVTDGTERARLFLARMDLPVHYHLPLTYAQLGTREAQGTLVLEAFSELALRRASPIDKELRQLTLSCMWFEPGSLLHMRPEDYVRAGAPEDSKPWKVIRKLAFPLVVEHSQTREQACYGHLITVCCWLTAMLDKYAKLETSGRTDWLYRDGKPEQLSVESLAREAGRY